MTDRVGVESERHRRRERLVGIIEDGTTVQLIDNRDVKAGQIFSLQQPKRLFKEWTRGKHHFRRRNVLRITIFGLDLQTTDAPTIGENVRHFAMYNLGIRAIF